MEKKMNYAWLLLFVVAVAAVAIILWLCAGQTAGSYSGGMLIELPAPVGGQQAFTAGEWL